MAPAPWYTLPGPIQPKYYENVYPTYRFDNNFFIRGGIFYFCFIALNNMDIQ